MAIVCPIQLEVKILSLSLSLSMDCARAACNDSINAFHTSNKQWNAYTVSSKHYLLVKQFFRNYKSDHDFPIFKES